MLASPRPRRFSRRAAFLCGCAGVGIAVAVGCGGGSDTGTGTFGGNGTTSATNSLSTSNGSGGELFTFASSSSGGGGEVGGGGTGGTTTGTTSSSTTTTMMPICDGNPTSGPAKWAAKNEDDNQGQFGQAVAADPFGNVYITGTYKGVFKMGGKAAEASNPANLATFVAKLNVNGVAQWVHGYQASPPGGNGVPRVAGQAVVTDDQGNLYLLGDLTGVTTFGSQSLQSTGGFFGDSFLVKYDTGGTVSWASRIGETQPAPANGAFGTQRMHGMALRKAATGNEILVGGDTQGALNLGGGIMLNASAVASQAAFVAVYRGGDGSAKLGLLFGDGSTDQAVYGVAWTSTGEILVTGSAAGPITFPGGVTLTPAGMQAAFVAKIKGDGSGTVWAKIYGNKSAVGNAIAVDANGNIFVAGDHQGDIDFGGGALSNNFGKNVFVAKLDAAGNHIWSHSYGDSVGQELRGIGVDAMGRVVLAGEYDGQLDFGGGALPAAGHDGFIAKLDTHGCQVWAKSIGDAMGQSAKGVAVDAMGNAIVTGTLTGSATFGGTTLTVPSGDAGGDVFVAQFGP